MISYVGGKSKIGKWIVPQIPKDIKTYVEVFGGMFWVYYNMDLEHFHLDKIVYNDFNPLNSNLFNHLKDPDYLYEQLKEYPVQSKELFDLYQKQLKENTIENDLERCCKYLYVLTQIFSGSKPLESKFMDLKGKYKCKFNIFMDKLKNENYRNHFKNITNVENLDFQDVILKYDSPTTYFYVDPPYYKTENYYSNHDFGLSDHIRLSRSLHQIKGKFGLSYYYFEGLDDLYPRDVYNWNEKEFSVNAGAQAGIKQNKKIELLIKNY